MKMKMNWGFWIIVSFVLFAFGTLAMVYISMSTSVDLVTEDYYEKELKYQDHIELLKSTNALDQNVDVQMTAESLMIRFPNIAQHDEYSGTIYFFRPSDKRGDFVKIIDVDSTHTQTLPTATFAKGFWRAKIFWNVREHHYYSELPVIIQ